MPRYTDLKDFIQKAKAIHGDKFDYTKAILKGKKVRLFCEKCQDYFECNAEYHIQPHKPNRPNNGGCKPCGYVLAGKKHHKPYNKALLVWKKTHGNAYDYSKAKASYRGMLHKIEIRCISCDFWFEQRGDMHGDGQGCPQCHWMKTERLFAELLTQRGLNPQSHRPKWLMNPDTGKTLELDFYFPHLNLAIEVQGLQHYQPVDIFGGEKGFQRRQKYDQLKRFLCYANGVILHEYDLRRGKKRADLEVFLDSIL